IAQMSNAYELRDIDLLDAQWRDAGGDTQAPGRTNLRYPHVWSPTGARAARTKLGKMFLGFSRFSPPRSAVDPHGLTTVRWTDVRFVAGGVAVDQRRPGPDIFTATVQIDTGGQILRERLGR